MLLMMTEILILLGGLVERPILFYRLTCNSHQLSLNVTKLKFGLGMRDIRLRRENILGWCGHCGCGEV